MRAALEFDMNSPDDRLRHKFALQGENATAVIYLLSKELKNYEELDGITIDEAHCYRKIQTKLTELAGKEGVTYEDTFIKE